MNKKREKRKAFTLAEILITLAIIGVVAALTIPNLIKDTDEKEYQTAAREAYSLFTNTQKKIAYDGVTLVNNASGLNYTLYLWSQSVKFQQICYNYSAWVYDLPPSTSADTPVTLGCWYDPTAANPPSQLWVNELNYKGAAAGILANGMLIGLRDSKFYIDVNGFKGPNTLGMDVYYFYYNTTTGLYDPSNMGSNTSVNILNRLYD